jgi:hypothetical protein
MVRKVKGQKFIEQMYPECPDAWQRYVSTTIAHNQQVRQLCQRDLAERLADMEAERENPEMYRYHAAQALCLQAQIDHHTAIIDKYTAPPPAPTWVKAAKPLGLPRPGRRKKRQSSTEISDRVEE